MQFKLQSDKAQGTLSLSGEITLLQTQELMLLLNKALKACDHVVIDTQEITEIDTAGLQLLCAAHKSAMSLNKQLVMDSNRPDVLTSRISQTGLTYQQHCEGFKDTNCFWIGGKR